MHDLVINIYLGMNCMVNIIASYITQTRLHSDNDYAATLFDAAVKRLEQVDYNRIKTDSVVSHCCLFIETSL